MGAVVIILLALCVLAAGYLLLILPTQWLKVEHVYWHRDAGTKILQISDVHIERNRAANHVYEVIANEKPDYIFLTGDYADTASALPKLKRFFEGLCAFDIPIYAVLGNHDYHFWSGNLLRLDAPVARLIERLGIHLLRNESIQLPEFWLVGIDDFDTNHADVEQSFRGVPEGQRRFVITHDPTLVLYLDRPYDALISGHLHGKQFNLPFLFKLQPMGPLAARGIYKGLHASEYGKYYISKGIGQSGHNMRLFVRSEITMHYF